MFIMKKKKEITNASEEENKREPLYTVSENVNWCSHTGNIKQFPLKTNQRTTKTSSSTPGFIPPKIKNRNLKRYVHPNDHSSTVHNNRDTEATYWPSKGEWIKIRVYKCGETHTRILLGHKEKDILPFATAGMDLEGFSEINQRKTNTACHHLYLESKKQKQIHRCSSYWRRKGRTR